MPKQGKTVPASMKQAIETVVGSAKGALGIPHLSELAEHFIRLRGGPYNVAKMLSQEWDTAPAGGVVRQRILEMLLRVWKSSDEQQKVIEDLGLLSEEDLEKLFQEQVAVLPQEEGPRQEETQSAQES